MAPFIYINGYPGVGKLTVAKELCKLLPNAKAVSNHLLIDPAAAVFERTDEAYQPLRRELRRAVLSAIATAQSARETTWVFTDQQSSNTTGRSAAKDYRDAAAMAGAPFVSVVLQCGLEENLARMAGPSRGVRGYNTKLTDPDILRWIRESEDILCFGGPYELVLDVTRLAAGEAAARVREHLDGLGLLDGQGDRMAEA